MFQTNVKREKHISNMTVFNIDTMMITKSFWRIVTFYNKLQLKTPILNLNNIYNNTHFTVYLIK